MYGMELLGTITAVSALSGLICAIIGYVSGISDIKLEKEKAWREGHTAGWNDAYRINQVGMPKTPNPYGPPSPFDGSTEKTSI